MTTILQSWLSSGVQDSQQMKDILVSALWWPNNVMEILFLNDFKHIFSISECKHLVGQDVCYQQRQRSVNIKMQPSRTAGSCLSEWNEWIHPAGSWYLHKLHNQVRFLMGCNRKKVYAWCSLNFKGKLALIKKSENWYFVFITLT